MGIVKKAVAIIAIILMILTSSMTIAVSNQKGKIITDTLRLRKEASLESTVLELLYKDNEVEIVGEEGDWYKVKYKTYTGYVSKEFVKTESQNSTVPTNEEKNTNNENNNQTTENNNGKQENQNNNNESTENNNSNQVNQNNNNQSVANNNQTTQNNTNNDQKAVVNNDLDVHILPLINSNVIGKFKANTNVELVSVTGVWTYVKTNELAGWIRLDKISIGNENTQSNNQTATQPESNQTATTQENNNTTENNQTTEQTNNKQESQTTMYSSAKTYYVKSSAVNVREKSNTDSSVVTTVSQNAEIKVVGEESNWYKVEVSGKSGYILKSLLSTTKTEVTTRSTTQGREEDSKKTTSEDKTEEKTSTKSSSSSSSKGNDVIAYAKKYLGCRYVYGGSGPSTFDCSGFTMYVYKHFGYSLPHNAVTQAKAGKYVAKSDLQPGDLIIFNNSANTSIGHVGMYVGGGSFIHASSGSGKIIISSLSGSYYKARYVTARRLV